MAFSRFVLAFALLLPACKEEETPMAETDTESGPTSGNNSGPPTGGGPCPEGGLLCGQTCTFLGSDENNCGECGVVCGAEEQCVGGMCLDLDPCDGGPGTPCGANCVDLQTNNNNCGDCGNNCGDGESCQGGECVPGGGNTTDPPDPTTGGPGDDDSSTGMGGEESSTGSMSGGGSSSSTGM